MIRLLPTPCVALWCATALLCLLGAAPGAAARPPADAGPETPATAGDPGWPRQYTTASGGRLTIHAPQIASWDDQRRLVAYAAVSHSLGAEAPVFGTIRVEADTSVALAERLVRLTTLAVTEASFGTAGPDRARRVITDIERTVPPPDRVLALDRVLAGLDTSQLRVREVDGVRAEPPAIHVRPAPALLVTFDGPPIWSPIAGTDLRYALNTNWDVFEQPSTTAFYLRHGRHWLQASSIEGPWTPAGPLPRGFSALPADGNWTEVRASLPGATVARASVPAVIVSTTPAELVVLQGAPSYVLTSPQNTLLWVHNTDSDVFRLGLSGPIYYLVAGRWFSAPDFTGPWTFATPSLPDDFRRIPRDHPRARVRASVPGTPEATEAVLLAQVPETARVARAAEAPVVHYTGAPQFAPIATTGVQRAVNTGLDVLRVGNLYYLCYDGVWFVASSPTGVWRVTGAVPAAIYTIPVSSPAYHVTYVTVVDDGPDHVVVATRAGYTGVTIAWGCAVWGTGWYYAPYVWYGGLAPVYYPHYATYGAAAWYNPAYGTYHRGAVAYGPYGGAGAAARYNPATGTYARGAVAWGPYGATGAAQAYNPRTGTYAATRQGAGVYGSWGTSTVQRGDEWARTARVTNDVTGVTRAGARTDDGAVAARSGPAGSGFVAAGEEGVYAGRDGNVYRRAEGGGWQKYEDGAWGSTQHPDDAASRARERAGDSTTLGQLEQDRAARAEGGARVRDSGAAQRPARPSGAPARPSGGRRPRG